MLFSGKITHSVLAYVARQGAGLEGLYESTGLPEEFLRDPSSWLEAEQVEAFLAIVQRDFGAKFNEPNLMETIGHACHDLWAWGVLDSVLRMMPKAQDIYLQPHRILSYFVSPAPELTHVQREEESITFELPLTTEAFPLVTEYLRAALESLPGYLGKDRVVVRWRQNQIYIGWSTAQQSFFESANGETNFKPELVNAMRSSLEQAQIELEQRKRELVTKDHELESLKTQLVQAAFNGGEISESIRNFGQAWHFDERLDLLKAQVRRFEDYMVRAQQLITLLIAQGRKDQQVAEAMKRVDWDYLRSAFPQLAGNIVDGLESLQRQMRSGALPVEQERKSNSAVGSDRRRPIDQQLNL